MIVLRGSCVQAYARRTPTLRSWSSPCDAIIGAFGNIVVTQLFQIKGAPYSLLDLLGDPALVDAHRNGRFITLRLTSSMYHRFHAPHDCRIERVTFIQWRRLR